MGIIQQQGSEEAPIWARLFAVQKTNQKSVFTQLKAELGYDNDKVAITRFIELVRNTPHLSYTKTLQYLHFALKVAQDINYTEAIVKIHTEIGYIYWHKSDYEHALQQFHLALDDNETLSNTENEARIYKGLGNTYLRIGNLDSASKHYLHSLSLYSKQKNEDACGSIYNNIGVIHKEKGEYEKSLSFYLKSLKIKEASDDVKAIANTYINVGIIYNMQEKYSQALNYFNKVLEISPAELGEVIFSNVHNNIGQVCVNSGDYEKALEHLAFARKIKIKIEDKRGTAFSYQEIGRIMFLKNEYEQAMENYSKAMDISLEIGAENDEADFLYLMAEVSYKMKDYEKAEEYLLHSYEIRKRLGLKPVLADCCKLLANLYYDMNKFKESCDYMRRLTTLQDELSSEEKSSLLAEMQTRFELQARDSTIKELNIKQEMLLKANNELELFAGKAAHDMKEPMRMMSSFSSLLSRQYNDQLDEKGREFLEHIHSGARRMEQLLSDMLKFAKSGANPEEAILVDLKDTLHIVKANLHVAIKEANAEIHAESLPVVHATHTTMIQLFQNIIANALKFRKPETPSIIKIKSEPYDDHFCKISIADNGIGIRKGQEEKVFVIFQRLNAKHEYEGSGIGLSTCKKIVECFGGKIWLSSVEGEGTTFSFLLPKTVLK